jgi:phenylpropionate dioxygenase-like ring-hydroxylating dioxygenase large terminal subunit
LDFVLEWCAVGLEKDIPPGLVVPSRIDDINLAIWRTTSGALRVFADRCPHRGMRLSHGFVRDDKLWCIYHGWRYKKTGVCDYIPAHPSLAPPSSICVQQYPCKEQNGVVWASLTPTKHEPPNLTGFSAVRSLEIEVSCKDVAKFFSQPKRKIIYIGDPGCFAIALQPTGTNRCVAHLLTNKKAKTASAWIEKKRTQIERLLQ